MDIDLDPLDEIFAERAANNGRAGGKFKPKAKPRPRKESSVPIVSAQSVQAVKIADNGSYPLAGSSLASSETLETKKSLETNAELVSGVHSSNKSALMNPLMEDFVIGETLGHNVGLHSDVITDMNGDLHSGKSAGESADIFFGFESLYDFCSQSTNPTVSGVNRYPEDGGLIVQLGNELPTSCPVNNHREFSPAPSEIPTGHVSLTRSAEDGPGIPIVSLLDDSAVRVSNSSSSYTCPEDTIAQDPLTCEQDVFSNSDGGFHASNRMLEEEEAEAVPCMESLDNLNELTTQSGQRRGKFQPKHKAQIGRSNSDPDGVDSIHCSQNDQSIPSESEYINDFSIPAHPLDDVLDFPSSRLGDSTSGLPENEEQLNLGETSCSNALNTGEHPNAVPDVQEKENEAGTSTRQLRKRINPCVLVDESGDEAHDDGNFSIECPSGSLIYEYDNDNDEDEYQMPNEALNTRAPRKSKTSAPQKQKPIRKRKKANEVSDNAAKEPPKKFSHSSLRKRRQVDKVLLDTPEDEIDMQKLTIRDIILLAEHRERLSSNGKTKQSAGDSFADYNGDDPSNPTVQESFTYTNYQSYMNKTPRSRWSKQDTELFYEAVRQFGSDISMIQQLFPGRTRPQIKLKYKKEERQHPLRLHEALATRSKDHSHFQRVIDHLQKIAAQEKQNSFRDNSIGLTGNEADVNPENTEEVAKHEQAEDVEVEVDMGPDVSEVHSPVKSNGSEGDFCGWGEYKSDF